MKTNCPNCGAPITGSECPYCGTVFERPENVLGLAVGRKVTISFEDGRRLYRFDMVLDSLAIDDVGESSAIYADGSVYEVFHTPDYQASIRGRIVPSEKYGLECLVEWRELEPEKITR